MSSYPIPSGEAERLNALERYRILDTEAERSFDNITLLASQICQSPIALVSLVDAERQWFKSKVGLEVDQTPREHAFCAHSIMSSEIMIVENARDDRRFANNPLVLGDPHIQFYAGAPLVDLDGHALGTLCVIDRTPRKLSDQQRQALQALSEQVVTLLEYRDTTHRLAAALEEVKTLSGLVPVCAWCNEIRDDDGFWQKVDVYITEQTNACVTHSICPKCAERNLKALAERRKKKKRSR